MERPIPALYACYLLRSTVRHASTYIGSTPHPVRRLKQHNGQVKGGAVRTSRLSLRPWEMSCLVTGFPSKIAALQFDRLEVGLSIINRWAWQMPNLTRHIAAEARVTQSNQTTRISPRTGKLRKRSARPRQSLTDRLANLHLLLLSTSFQRWPLELTFYNDDVYRVWRTWSERQQQQPLPQRIKVHFDQGKSTTQQETLHAEGSTKSSLDYGIHALDFTYLGHKAHLEKSRSILGGVSVPKCSVCMHKLPSSGAGWLVCQHQACSAVSHMQCLSTAFLQSESNSDNEIVIPTHGPCPSCGGELEWASLVKELSLRMRGEKEVEALFKPPRGKGAAKAAAIENTGMSEDDEDDAMGLVLDYESDEHAENLSNPTDEDVAGPLIATPAPDPGHRSTSFKRPSLKFPGPEPVIDDSDWDNAEVIE